MLKKISISSSTLHIVAMFFMLCDHLWASLFSNFRILTCLGRIAFPIFAFMLVEGFFNTRNLKKYFFRLFIFALISEIPFDLMCNNSLFYILHQNVLWTFIIGLTCIFLIEKIKAKKKIVLTVIVSFFVVILGLLFSFSTFVDYYGFGIATIFIFYFFRGKKWWNYLGQFICLYYLNVEVMGGFYYPLNILGFEFDLMEQSIALFSLIFIWLYNGEKGIDNKYFKYFCYGFYPFHMIVLYFISFLPNL